MNFEGLGQERHQSQARRLMTNRRRRVEDGERACSEGSEICQRLSHFCHTAPSPHTRFDDSTSSDLEPEGFPFGQHYN